MSPHAAVGKICCDSIEGNWFSPERWIPSKNTYIYLSRTFCVSNTHKTIVTGKRRAECSWRKEESKPNRRSYEEEEHLRYRVRVSLEVARKWAVVSCYSSPAWRTRAFAKSDTYFRATRTRLTAGTRSISGRRFSRSIPPILELSRATITLPLPVSRKIVCQNFFFFFRNDIRPFIFISVTIAKHYSKVISNSNNVTSDRWTWRNFSENTVSSINGDRKYRQPYKTEFL